MKLLDFISKGIAWATGLISKIEVSADEWWTAFTQLSFTLYDEGPTQNKIWSQADGKGYDLETKGSGKEVWIAALQKLRNGHCGGDINVKKLLKAMLEENKRNEELKNFKKPLERNMNTIVIQTALSLEQEAVVSKLKNVGDYEHPISKNYL